MYSFASEENKALFMAGLERTMTGAGLMHISGTLTLIDGTYIILDGDDNIIGTPVIETQILEDPTVFNIGELYIGTLDITLNVNQGELEMQGAEITLSVSVDGCPESVPMGVWDVNTAKKQVSGAIKITAYDRIAKLSAPIPSGSGSGIIRFSYIMSYIEELTGIEFAQSIADLQELCSDVQIDDIYPVSTYFAPSCWLEVQYIAQFLGCYVIANREGKIEFRRFALQPVETITADKRFNIDLGCGMFYVEGFSYTDKYGRTVTKTHSGIGSVSSIIVLPQENPFIWDYDDEERAEREYGQILRRLSELFVRTSSTIPNWHSGTTDYYGDPALDVGDMIALTGGINGSRTLYYLIGHITWQFRGPQTLISGGAPRTGNAVSSSGGGGGNIYSSNVMNITKEIILANLTGYKGQLFDNFYRTAARCRFSAKEETAAFITCTMTFTGTASAQILRDGVPMEIEPCSTGMLSFSLPYMAEGGVHDIRIMLIGSGELTAVQGAVWGQNINAQELPYSGDWEYEIVNNTAVITGYTGSDTVLEVPEVLEGKPTVKIAENALAYNTDVQAVYIPDGVEIIE